MIKIMIESWPCIDDQSMADGITHTICGCFTGTLTDLATHFFSVWSSFFFWFDIHWLRSSSSVKYQLPKEQIHSETLRELGSLVLCERRHCTLNVWERAQKDGFLFFLVFVWNCHCTLERNRPSCLVLVTQVKFPMQFLLVVFHLNHSLSLADTIRLGTLPSLRGVRVRSVTHSPFAGVNSHDFWAIAASLLARATCDWLILSSGGSNWLQIGVDCRRTSLLGALNKLNQSITTK